jgi:hypothetical protein
MRKNYACIINARLGFAMPELRILLNLLRKSNPIDLQ